MIFKFYICLIFSFLVVVFCKSQNYYTFKVIDSITNNPVIGAIINNSNKNILSNQDGNFKITSFDGKINISHIGFNSKSLFLNKNDSIIKLLPIILQLDNVEKSSSTLNLIKDVVNKIKFNYYANNKTVLNGVLHQEAILRNNNTFKDSGIKSILLQTAKVNILYPAYSKFELPKVNYISKAEKMLSDNPNYIDLNNVHFVFSLIEISEADIVLKKMFFLNELELKKYNYAPKGKIKLNDRIAIQIDFFAKNSNKKHGTIFIDSITHAVMACNYYQFIPNSYETPIVFRNIFIQYKIDTNQKWSVDFINRKTVYEKDKIKNFWTENLYFKCDHNEIYNSTSKLEFYDVNFNDFAFHKDSNINQDNYNLVSQFKNYNNFYEVSSDKIKNNKQSKLNIRVINWMKGIDNYNVRLYFDSYNFYKQYVFGLGAHFRIYRNLYLYLNATLNNFNGPAILNINKSYNVKNYLYGLGYKLNLSKSNSFNKLLFYSGYYNEELNFNNTTYINQNIQIGLNYERFLSKHFNYYFGINHPIFNIKWDIQNNLNSQFNFQTGVVWKLSFF